MDLRTSKGLLAGLVGIVGCFSPNADSETGTASEASTSTGGTTGPSGSEDASVTSPSTTDSPSSGPTSTLPADESSSAGETVDDTTTVTTGDPQCDDATPCADGEYCVDQVCLDPPEGFVAVPSGAFMMGCNEALDAACEDNEYPYHEVTLSAFAIGRTEVTAAEYQACVDAGSCSTPQPMNGFGDPCDAGSGNLPAACVNWFQAADYCAWIDATLPTEAQWEKASRGTDGRTYPWGEDAPTCTLTNMSGCSPTGGSDIIEVGSKPAGASPYGALDMSGNVFEWVADWYDAAYYVGSPDTDPPGPANGTQRVLRSAASNYVDVAQRSAFRGVDFETTSPSDGNGNIGFRCAYNP